MAKNKNPLRQLREEAGMTLRMLEDGCRTTSRATINQMERSPALDSLVPFERITLGHLADVCRALGVPLTVVMGQYDITLKGPR